MLDLAGIMFSSIMMVLVVMKAVQLDRILPWFEIPASLLKKPAVVEKAPAAQRGDIPSWRARASEATPTRRPPA